MRNTVKRRAGKAFVLLTGTYHRRRVPEILKIQMDGYVNQELTQLNRCDY